MTLTMYDSTAAADIPPTAAAVLGYVSGRYVWSAADWQRFAGKPQLRCAVSAGTDAGEVLDCETGDATPDECPGWVVRARARGVGRPIVYCNRSIWPTVRACFQGAHVPEPDYIVADWTGVPHAISGAAAVQYADPVTSGGHWDLTLVSDTGIFPGSATQASPAPIKEEAPMGAGYVEVAEDGGLFAFGDIAARVNGWDRSHVQIAGDKVVAAKFNADASGMYLVTASGAIYAIGANVNYDGGMNGQHLNAPVCDLLVPPA